MTKVSKIAVEAWGLLSSKEPLRYLAAKGIEAAGWSDGMSHTRPRKHAKTGTVKHLGCCRTWQAISALINKQTWGGRRY